MASEVGGFLNTFVVICAVVKLVNLRETHHHHQINVWFKTRWFIKRGVLTDEMAYRNLGHFFFFPFSARCLSF